MFEIAPKLLDFLDRRSRWHIGLLVVPMLVVAVLEMASIGLILPVIQVLLLGDTTGRFTSILVSVLPDATRMQSAILVVGVFAEFFVFKNLFLLAMTYVINRVIFVKTARFTTRMYGIYLSRPLTFHFRRNSAEILRDLTTGVWNSFHAVRLLLLMTLESLLMLAAFGLLLYVNWEMTLAVVAVLAVVGIVYYRISSPIFCWWGQRNKQLDGALLKWITQSVNSIRDVKLLDAYGYLDGVMTEVTQNKARYLTLVTTAQNIPRLMTETVIVLCFLLVALGLLAFVADPGEVIPILGLFGMAALRVMPSLNRLLASATDLRHRTAYVEAIHQDLVDGLEDADRAESVETAQPIPFDREITLESVVYTYQDLEHNVLHGVDLTITKGDSVGFVGPSGAGKTTLIDIMLGLLRPLQGKLLVDGKDAFADLAGWQRHLGYVPQSVYLLDDTLRRNIAFGVEDAAIDEARIADVVRMASLESVVAELPNGLDTLVGESGARLSGGQRQRVAIARALYRDPDVLVFDEATAALDNETEREVTRAIETLAGDKTVLIIAHRLSTVRNCDRLVFMKAGRVVAVGSFDELLAENAEFRRMVQLGGFETEAA